MDMRSRCTGPRGNGNLQLSHPSVRHLSRDVGRRPVRTLLRRISTRKPARTPLHVTGFLPATSSQSDKRNTELWTRKLYLKNFYYAVGFTETTQRGKVQRVKILDMHVALWRDKNGNVHCVTDECPLTGSRLSEGSFVTTRRADGTALETITNADRSATFDADTGALLTVLPGTRPPSSPQLPADSPALQEAEGHEARVEVWDCVEKGGFVWLYFGDKDTPMKARRPVPWVPELGKQGWHGAYGEVTIKGNHWMVIENVIDMAHVPYVHAGTVGDHAAFVDIVIKQTENTLNFAFPIENHHKEGEDVKFHVDVQATACMPSTSFIRFQFPFGLRLCTINSVVPVDESTTTIRFCQMRNFAKTSLLDPAIRQGMKNILGEDKVIIEMLRPEEVATEISLAADAPQMAYRKMRERYINQGDYVEFGPRPLHVVQRKRLQMGSGAS